MMQLSDSLPWFIMQLTRHVDANASLCSLIRSLATRPGPIFQDNWYRRHDDWKLEARE